MHPGKMNKHKKVRYDYSRYDYLYLIHEKSQSLDIFKSFNAKVELQLENKIKDVKSDHGGEYYGIYDESREQHLGPFGEALKTTLCVLHRMPSKGCPTEAQPYMLHERKFDSRIISCYFIGYVERSQGYKFYNPTPRSFFETGNARFLEEVKFEKEENIRNETTPIIEDNVQTIVPDIVLPKTPIEQPQQPQEVSLRRSIRDRRHAILVDCFVFSPIT
ncbi:hypothetical protein CR513_21377, partial [Mucuna pruriens]